MTQTASSPAIWPKSQTYVRPTPALLTRKGFHAYFAKRLTGLACDNQGFNDWRGFRLPAYLKRGITAVRQAYPLN